MLSLHTWLLTAGSWVLPSSWLLIHMDLHGWSK